MIYCRNGITEQFLKRDSNSSANAKSLRAKYGKDLLVLGWTGAAGDQSPHLMFRKRAEERMRELRGLSRLDELSRRIAGGAGCAWAANKTRKRAAKAKRYMATSRDGLYNHTVRGISLTLKFHGESWKAKCATESRESPGDELHLL